jgi:hypothetical protein
MTAKKISELVAKTPVSTDLIPVADPTTGIAGKSTIAQIMAGGGLPAITGGGRYLVSNQDGTAYTNIDTHPTDAGAYVSTTASTAIVNGFPTASRVGYGSYGVGTNYPNLTTLTYADLTILTIYSNTALLVRLYPLLQSFDARNLILCNGGIFINDNPSMTYVYLNSLSHVGSLGLNANANLVNIQISFLRYCYGDFSITNNSSLTSVGYNTSYFKGVSGQIIWTGNAFTQATVDNLLVNVAAMDGTNGKFLYSNNTINLSGGTNSTPSATGLAAKATLVSRGCTVTHN